MFGDHSPEVVNVYKNTLSFNKGMYFEMWRYGKNVTKLNDLYLDHLCDHYKINHNQGICKF